MQSGHQTADARDARRSPAQRYALARRALKRACPQSGAYCRCLYYKQDETPLPIVTEKGAGHHALRMIGIAQQYQVPIVANIPLAQQLMRDAKVDETIP